MADSLEDQSRTRQCVIEICKSPTFLDAMDNAYHFVQCRSRLTLAVDATKCRVSNFTIHTLNAQG